MRWLLPTMILISLIHGPFTLAATITKVDRAKETVLVKLNKSEQSRIEKGQDITIVADGESVDARIEGVSGKSAKLKILFGIEHLSEGSKVELTSGSVRKKMTGTDDQDESQSMAAASSSPAQSKFSFGTGGAEHPWAGELQAPWVTNAQTQAPTQFNLLDHQRSFNFVNPAQMMRVKKYAVITGIDYVNAKSTEKTGAIKQEIAVTGQAIGFTGVAHIHNGFRVGLGYEQDNDVFKSKVKGTATGSTTKVKLEREVTSLLLSAPIGDRYGFGAEYVQYDVKQKPENTDSRSISANYWRPGIIYYLKDVEAGLKYSPPISIRESGMSYQDPRRILLHVQKKSDSMRSVGGAIEHVNLNGIDEDSVNYFNLRVGTTTYGLPWGGWGVLVHYRSKSYGDKRSANSFSLPSYGLSVLTDYTIDKMSVLAFDITLTLGDGQADKSAITDAKTKIKLQHVAANLTYRYML